MIRISLILVLLFTFLGVRDVFAIDREIYGKIGTGYATEPSRFGLDVACQYNFVLDPYFVVGPEVGFFWVKWNRTIGKEQISSVEVDVKSDTNAYDLPVYMNATILLPNARKTLGVTPFATIGLGYSFMIIHYSQPEYTDAGTLKSYESDSITKFFTGFAWQFVLGAGYQPEGSKVEFRGEAGYRDSKLKSDNLEIDFSGYTFRVGAKYPLGG